MDFEEYASYGGTMSRAEFFNAKLTGSQVTDSLSVRLADHMGVPQEKGHKTLTERIRDSLASTG
jgi:hypothetical protein